MLAAVLAMASCNCSDWPADCVPGPPAGKCWSWRCCCSASFNINPGCPHSHCDHPVHFIYSSAVPRSFPSFFLLPSPASASLRHPFFLSLSVCDLTVIFNTPTHSFAPRAALTVLKLIWAKQITYSILPPPHLNTHQNYQQCSPEAFPILPSFCSLLPNLHKPARMVCSHQHLESAE